MKSLPSKGHLFWRKEFYSMCSKHQINNPDCSLCKNGRWCNVWKQHVSHIIFMIAPELWRWWVNKRRS